MVRVSGLECFALALLLAAQPAAAASRKAAPGDTAKPAEKAQSAPGPKPSAETPKPQPEKPASEKPQSQKTDTSKPDASKPGSTKDSAEPESATPSAASPKTESDDDDFSFDEPEKDDSSKAASETKQESPAPKELPLGVATDEDGAPLVAVHFRGEPGTRYFVGPPRAQNDSFGNLGRVRLDMDELRELCESPCARWLYPGSYSLALSRKGDPVRTSELLSISEPVELDGEYHSNALVRTLGYVAMGVGIVGGSLLVASSVSDCGSTDGTCLQKSANVFIGAGVMLAGLTGGLLLTQVKDRAEVSTKPASPRLGEPK